MLKRQGEEHIETQFYRTERFVQINASWFFMARDGVQEGPFNNRAEAQEALQLYLSVVKSGLLDSLHETNSRHSGDLRQAEKPAYPFSKVATVHKAPFKVQRIEFTPVAQDVQEIDNASSSCANDSFHFCCL